MAFTYYSAVTVNGSGQVPATQTNYPMLVNYTDNRFKTSGGGHVLNASGFDIRPYDAVGGSAMTYQLDFFDGSTGQVVMWVLVPSLTSSAVIYLYYGDAALTTDGSSTSVWDSNYKGVWHLGNGSTLSATDATANGNSDGSPTATATSSGKINGGASYNGTTSSINVGSAASVDNMVPLTLSAWVSANSIGENSAGRIADKTGASTSGWFSYIGSGPIFGFSQYSNSGSTLGSWGTSAGVAKIDGTKQFWTVTFDNSSASNDPIFYVNGASVTVTESVAPVGSAVSDASNSLFLGNRSDGARTWDGMIDELRVSNIARSANWILIDYNNQNAPSTFATLGTEVNLGGVVGYRGFFMF